MSSEALKVLRERRSVRRFLDKPVAKEMLEKIMDIARHAPTAHNKQPWEIVIIEDSETRKAIAKETDYGSFIADAPACIAVFCEESTFYVEDGSAIVTYILLAAEALGFGTCWVAGDKKFYAPKISRLLEAPQKMKLHALIPIGYPSQKPAPYKRALSDMLHWEKF